MLVAKCKYKGRFTRALSLYHFNGANIAAHALNEAAGLACFNSPFT
jgi:hypothetical protein